MRVVCAGIAGLFLAAPALAQEDPRLLGPKTLLPAHVLCTDLPVSARPQPTLLVAGGHTTDGRESLGRGDQVVVSGGTADGLAAGQRLVARRLQGAAEAFPRPGEGFGAVRTSAVLTLTAVGDTSSLARIDFACDAVDVGDYLEPYAEPALPSSAGPSGEPRFDDRASVLFGVDRRQIFGDGDVVSVDRGTTHGLAAGDRLAIYRDSQNGLPLVPLGEALVVEPSEQTSKVVLVKVRDAVRAGDVAVMRR